MTTRTFKVLHIDDDPALGRLVAKFLTRRGFETRNVRSAEDGLASLDEDGADVVVLDHFLEADTGLGVLSALRERDPALPVVYVTASTEPTVAVEALKAGASDYVLKTVGDGFLELLASAIEQSIEKARLQRERDRAEQEVRTARDRAEILLAEVNHRVANSLSLVAALVRMQSSALADPEAKDAFAETEARIAAIASLHRRLYTSDDVRHVELDQYLSALVQELESSMKSAGHSSSTKVQFDRFSIPTDKAVSVGMIVTELVTNAYKYAYPDREDGEVRVILRRASESHATLIVEDDGIGWSGEGPVKGTGLGTKIVSAMATNLGTSIAYGGADRGTRGLLELKL